MAKKAKRSPSTHEDWKRIRSRPENTFLSSRSPRRISLPWPETLHTGFQWWINPGKIILLFILMFSVFFLRGARVLNVLSNSFKVWHNSGPPSIILDTNQCSGVLSACGTFEVCLLWRLLFGLHHRWPEAAGKRIQSLKKRACKTKLGIITTQYLCH